MADDRPGEGALEDPICVGAIAGVRGVRGEVRIKSFTADPRAIANYGDLYGGDGERRFKIRIKGEARGLLIAAIDGIADRDAAEALKGTRLYVSRRVLPAADEDEYYHVDLIGLRAEFVDGRVGTVHLVHDFGAGAVLEITALEGSDGDAGASVLVPFTKAAVPLVDMPGGRVVIDPPPGLLDAADEESDGAEREDVRSADGDGK